MTILANKLAAAQVAKEAEKPPSILARKRATTPRGEYTEMPMFGRVWVELPGEMVTDEIESAVHAAMGALKLPMNALNGLTWASRRNALTLAWSVRNPDDHAERVGTQDEWCGLDIDLIEACAFVYQDVRERVAPIELKELTLEQVDEIRLAIEKKNTMALRACGVVALSHYLLSMASQPASSPTTQSSNGPSQ